jgi:hypothetical protein
MRAMISIKAADKSRRGLHRFHHSEDARACDRRQLFGFDAGLIGSPHDPVKGHGFFTCLDGKA